MNLVMMQDLANLEVLDVLEGNTEQALVDLQLSLAAYTKVVINNLGDSVPKHVFMQLVSQGRMTLVRKSAFAQSVASKWPLHHIVFLPLPVLQSLKPSESRMIVLAIGNWEVAVSTTCLLFPNLAAHSLHHLHPLGL